MQYQFQILDPDQVNNISRWAFGNAVDFRYPIRHQLLQITLEPEQHTEFLDRFGLYVQAV